jgi:uncharacterized membrane protein YhiD involved in acid resistance
MKLDLKNQTVRAVIVFLLVLVGSGLLVYAVLRGTSSPTSSTTQTRPATGAPTEPEAVTGAVPDNSRRVPDRSPNPEENKSFIARLFESNSAEAAYATEGLGMTIIRIVLRLLLAGALGAALAFRPRRQLPSLRRNPYVAQTQILLAIVASALMMIVGDNAARAFGIFAAVSLVRFRTNIRDPKEISVLLISLAVGLATGVGRPEIAVIVCFFALAVLWFLERSEAKEVSRSMQLKVMTRDLESTEGALKKVLARHQFGTELRSVTRDGDERSGTIVESVDINPVVSTDKLSEEIFAEDSNHITGIEWEQKKSFSYFYQ